MPNSKDIIQDAASLPVEERLIIVNSLLHSLNPPNPTIDQVWAESARNRLEELRNGSAEAIPADEVFTSMGKRLGL